MGTITEIAKRRKPSEFETDLSKNRSVKLTDEQWDRVLYYGRVIEARKELPHGCLSRQHVLQFLVEQMPDPPEGFTSKTRIDRDNLPDEGPGFVRFESSQANTSSPGNGKKLIKR